MSLGAVSEIIARLRWASSSERTSERARSSSFASNRQPIYGPEGTRAGFAPMKAGVATVSPAAEVKLKET